MKNALPNPFAPEMFLLDEDAFLAALAPQDKDVSSLDANMTTAPEIEQFDLERLALLANKGPQPVHSAAVFYLYFWICRKDVPTPMPSSLWLIPTASRASRTLSPI